MVRVEDLSDSAAKSDRELIDLAFEAAEFLKWHHWCKGIQNQYLDREWPGILAVFYFEIETSTQKADDKLWVVVGDLPPAYLDIFSCPNGATAIESYVGAMQDWIDHVNAGQPLEEFIPVYQRRSHTRVKPADEYVGMLESRLNFIRTEILPKYRDELDE